MGNIRKFDLYVYDGDGYLMEGICDLKPQDDPKGEFCYAADVEDLERKLLLMTDRVKLAERMLDSLGLVVEENER